MVLIIAVWWLSAAPAHAIKFEFTYSAYSGNSTATGWIELSDAYFRNPTLTAIGESDTYFVGAGIIGLSITVTDGAAAPVTYTQSSYNALNWYTGHDANGNPITLNATWPNNIVGDYMFTDPYSGSITFGMTGVGFLAGDFSLVANNGSGAPTYYDYFLLQYNGDVMQLASLTAVPEPATWLLMAVGLLGLGIWHTRREGYFYAGLKRYTSRGLAA